MSEEFIDRARRMHRIIRVALLNEWDPIGVKNIPQAQDEYDGYVPTIYNILICRKTKQEMFAFLWWLETEYMALVGNRQATEAFAERLVSLVRESEVI